MATITLNVSDHKITVDNSVLLAQDSNNYDKIKFIFDDTWDGYTRYAILYQKLNDITKIALVNDGCDIPSCALKQNSPLYIGARGISSSGDSMRVTTQMISFQVASGAINGVDGVPEEISTQEYRALLAKVDGKVDINQGISNSGKILGINSSGKVVPIDFQGSDAPNNTEIDTTLTISGKAADAKVVGTKFTEVNKNLSSKANTSDIPKTLPNPNALSITVNGTTTNYDGTSAKSIIFEAGSSDVEVDSTLTQSGKAADAKTTGDRLTTIEDKLSDLAYEAIAITSFGNSVNTAEMGSTVNAVTLNWAVNKTPVSLTLDGSTIDASLTSKALTGLGLTANKTWTLVATDDRSATSQKTTTLNFYNGIYYGIATEGTYDNAFILALTKVLSGTKARTITVNAGAGQYIYYCLPARLGTPAFNVGGFDGGFTKVSTINFTNASGYTENYDIWKSDNANLGSTTVKIS